MAVDVVLSPKFHTQLATFAFVLLNVTDKGAQPLSGVAAKLAHCVVPTWIIVGESTVSMQPFAFTTINDTE